METSHIARFIADPTSTPVIVLDTGTGTCEGHVCLGDRVTGISVRLDDDSRIVALPRDVVALHSERGMAIMDDRMTIPMPAGGWSLFRRRVPVSVVGEV